MQTTFRWAHSPSLPLIGAFVLFLVELVVIGVTFKHGVNFTCLANWPAQACSGPSGLLISIYCVTGALTLFAVLFPNPVQRLLSQAGGRLWPLGVNILGAVIAMLPIKFLAEGTSTTYLVPSFLCWGLGMALLLSGLLLYLAPLDHWIRFVREQGMRLIPLFLVAASTPALATVIRPLWQLDTIASGTFTAVDFVIQKIGYEVVSYPEHRIIGADGFFIDIAPVCSGIEGIALVTIFVTLYLFLFKAELRFPRVFILYPIGIAISASLNIVRIVALLAIGLNGNAELAVGGFHSHAGWVMFTVVALGIILVANKVAWLRKTDPENTLARSGAEVPPFFQDWTVAMILPFAVFMLSAMLVQAFSQSPSVVYPARALLMVGALALFLPLYRKLDWRLDPVAIAIGVAIAVMWIAIPVAEPMTEPPYGDLTGWLLVLWFVARGFGTTVLVPLIEELFFRGYLEHKLQQKESLIWAIGAAIVVAAIFAILHGRWAEAFVASLAFSYVMRRHGRVTDAVISHGVANGLIFAIAAATGQVHII